ncbi:restriction endonuclease subunit S [Acetobacter okinawensis]|uniref:restriction endonuclease subunit S n=1 Tax=Acetobacter okinawensis TaxID=1076594 RepID=UPI0020A0B10C|nr:restriction endonuclease subunit S [Acetobacter okinawensis]MCP1214346.1 restriction endonuclease subunit S [Acetobacter okinawensis]
MSWPAVALGEVADINPRGPGRGELAPSAEVDFVPMASVSEGGEMTVSERRTYDEVSKGFTAFKPSDVLLAKITPCFENNKIAKSKVSTKYAFGSTEFHVLRGKPEALDPDYLTYFLRQDHIREAGERRMTGSGGQRRVPKTFLEELKIPLPPLEEQKRIAGILDQAAELCRLRTRALDKLSILGQAIFHEMFGDPVDNPKGFPRKKLLEIVDIIGGSQPAKKHFLYDDGPGRVRFVQTRDFRTDAYKTYVPEDLAKRPFSEDDVIIGRYGPPVFQIFRGLAGTYNVALMKAQPIGEITKDFVFHLLQEPKLHGYVVANSERTAGQSGVNLDLLKDYPVYAPPIELQTDFSQRLTEVDTVTRNARRQNLEAQTLFASLQHRAFRGEL